MLVNGLHQHGSLWTLSLYPCSTAADSITGSWALRCQRSGPLSLQETRPVLSTNHPFGTGI